MEVLQKLALRSPLPPLLLSTTDSYEGAMFKFSFDVEVG